MPRARRKPTRCTTRTARHPTACRLSSTALRAIADPYSARRAIIGSTRVARADTWVGANEQETVYRTMGFVESCCQSWYEPTYTRAGIPAARAAQYIRL